MEIERYDRMMAERGFVKVWFSQNGRACFSYERPIMVKYLAEDERTVKQAARNFAASRVVPSEELPKAKKRKRGGW